MQKVAELMKDRLDLTMREQCRLAIDRRAHVANDQSEVRLARMTGMQRVHPRTTALRFARMPVGIKRSEMSAAVGVVNFIKRNLRVPNFDFG